MAEINKNLRNALMALPAGVMIGAVLSPFLLTVLYTEEGRGSEINSCPKDYESYYSSMIEVTDARALGSLALISKEKGVEDSFASGYGYFKADLATEPGELACRSDLNRIVLLPAGDVAMQHSSDYDPFDGKLPAGLKTAETSQTP